MCSSTTASKKSSTNNKQKTQKEKQKMKTKTFVKWAFGLVAVGLVAFPSAARAQTNLSFLTSKAALRAYAVEQAVSANSSIYSPSQVGNQTTGYGYIIPTNHTSVDIFKGYVGQTFSITILNPQDWVYLNAWVLNSDGDELFYGYSSTQPVLGKGGYSLPAIPSLTLTIASYIPVKFINAVSSAEIMYTDPSTGQTYNYQQLQSYGNKIYFPSDSAGDGFLVVNFTDGTQANYDLKHGGAKTSGTSISQTISSANIDNLLSYTNPVQVVDELQSQGGIGENRTYEVLAGYGVNCPVGYTCVPVSPAFYVWTSEGVVPIGYYYRKAGSLTWQYVQTSDGSAYIPFTASGTWYVVPNWNPLQFSEPAPNIYNGGGKG
jgi:hypothetical protein